MRSSSTPKPSRRAARAALLKHTILENPYIPHAPTIKQAQMLVTHEREVLFGGAAGGGKSDAMLMAALQHVTVPGYSAIIFRRTLSDLKASDGLIPRSHEWLSNTDARWNGNDYLWAFPSGATIHFGYMNSENDRYRYKSAAYIRQIWEELTTFTEAQYRYVQSRSRRIVGFPIRIQTFAASNPDGPGAEWVQQRFVPLRDDGSYDPALQHRNRRFIQARLDDNPHLDTEEYERSLALLPIPVRKQLRDGRWDVRNMGGMVDRAMFGELVEPHEVPTFTDTVRAWDLAATKPTTQTPDPDWTRGVLLGLHDGVTYICDMQSCREEPGGVRQLLRSTASDDGASVRIALPQDPGQAGKDQVVSYAKELRGHAVTRVNVTQNKARMATPWAADAGNGLVRVVRGNWNRAFFAEVEAFPTKGVHDDQVDAVSIGHKVLGRRSWKAA